MDGIWPEVVIGDCREVLRSMPSESVHMVCTSPPYWGLRDYGVSGQIGLESDPESHVSVLCEVFEEVRRVLRKDGTLWLNYGDCYACQKNGRAADEIVGDDRRFRDKPFSTVTAAIHRKNGYPCVPGPNRSPQINLKSKDLAGMPWRVAFALQQAGWWLRSDIIWSKPNPMPESVTDRPTRAHEYLFLLAKSDRYYYDADAIRDKWADERRGDPGGNGAVKATTEVPRHRKTYTGAPMVSGRNKRSVWEIATQPLPYQHFASFPEALVEPCILAGTSECGCCPDCGSPWRRVVEAKSVTTRTPRTNKYARGNGHQRCDVDVIRERRVREAVTTGWQPSCQCGREDTVPATVLDPFCGSGTTLRVATNLGRRSIGIDLSNEHLKIIKKRTAQGGLGI